MSQSAVKPGADKDGNIPNQHRRTTSSFTGRAPSASPRSLSTNVRTPKQRPRGSFLSPVSLDRSPGQWSYCQWTLWRCCCCSSSVFLRCEGTRTPDASPLFLLPEVSDANRKWKLFRKYRRQLSGICWQRPIPQESAHCLQCHTAHVWEWMCIYLSINKNTSQIRCCFEWVCVLFLWTVPRCRLTLYRKDGWYSHIAHCVPVMQTLHLC